jgi:hypothetical protein
MRRRGAHIHREIYIYARPTNIRIRHIINVSFRRIRTRLIRIWLMWRVNLLGMRRNWRYIVGRRMMIGPLSVWHILVWLLCRFRFVLIIRWIFVPFIPVWRFICVINIRIIIVVIIGVRAFIILRFILWMNFISLLHPFVMFMRILMSTFNNLWVSVLRKVFVRLIQVFERLRTILIPIRQFFMVFRAINRRRKRCTKTILILFDSLRIWKFLYFRLLILRCVYICQRLYLLDLWFNNFFVLMNFLYFSWWRFGINNLHFFNFSIDLKVERSRKWLFLNLVANWLHFLNVFDGLLKLFFELILKNLFFRQEFHIWNYGMNHLENWKYISFVCRDQNKLSILNTIPPWFCFLPLSLIFLLLMHTQRPNRIDIICNKFFTRIFVVMVMPIRIATFAGFCS